MSDLAKKLRDEAAILPHELYSVLNPVLIEAADEIERLRAKLAFVQAQVRNDCDVDMEPCQPAECCLCAQQAKERGYEQSTS